MLLPNTDNAKKPAVWAWNPHLQVPIDIAVLVVLWRLQYKLSPRIVAEMFLTRSFSFTHETVRAWEERLAPLLTCAGRFGHPLAQRHYDHPTEAA